MFSFNILLKFLLVQAANIHASHICQGPTVCYGQCGVGH